MPEASLALPSAAALPLEVVPASSACEPLEYLTELVHEGLERHQTLSRTLAENVIDSAEVLVRTGWALADARSYLAQAGAVGKWEQTHFPQVSRAWLARLHRLSSAFARDLPDTQQRQRLGIVVEGLPAVTTSVHLRSQLVQVAPKSVNELFRLTGVLPATPSKTANSKKVRISGSTPPGTKNVHWEAIDLAEQLQIKLNQLDPITMGEPPRAELCRVLRPLLTYAHALNLPA
jgi:hypothetical protein